MQKRSKEEKTDLAADKSIKLNRVTTFSLCRVQISPITLIVEIQGRFNQCLQCLTIILLSDYLAFHTFIFPDLSTLYFLQYQLTIILIFYSISNLYRVYKIILLQQINLMDSSNLSLQFSLPSLPNSSKQSTIYAMRHCRFNLYDSTFITGNLRTKEEEKLNEYLQQVEKDKERYWLLKQKMKQRIFNLEPRSGRYNRKRPLFLSLSKVKQSQKQTSLESQSLLKSSSNTQKECNKIQQLSRKQQQIHQFRIKRTNRQNFSEDIEKLAKSSRIQSISAVERQKKRGRFQYRSELVKKSEKEISEQKSLIIKFIKNEPAKCELEWGDLTNSDKYLMTFNQYMKKKTKSAIEQEIFERRIKKEKNKVQKFQEFILEEVYFNDDHKIKLNEFFRKIQGEFKKAEISSQKDAFKSILSLKRD